MRCPTAVYRIVGLLLLYAMLGCQSSDGYQDRPPLAPTPENLIVYVERTQRRYVRISFGELSNECFNDADLARFLKDNIEGRAVREARLSGEFKAIVKSLLTLVPEARGQWLDRARRHYHPTWAQLGLVTRDGSGQTEAGQRAESILAVALASLAVELLGAERR